MDCLKVGSVICTENGRHYLVKGILCKNGRSLYANAVTISNEKCLVLISDITKVINDHYFFAYVGDPQRGKEIKHCLETNSHKTHLLCNDPNMVYYICLAGSVWYMSKDLFKKLRPWWNVVTLNQTKQNENKLQGKETSGSKRNESRTGTICCSRNKFESSVGHLSNRAINFVNKIRINGIEK